MTCVTCVWVCLCVLAYVSVYGCVGVYVRGSVYIFVYVCVRVCASNCAMSITLEVARGHLTVLGRGRASVFRQGARATCRLPALHLMRRLLAVVPA